MILRGTVGPDLIPIVHVRIIPGRPPLACLVDTGFNDDVALPTKLIAACRMKRGRFVPCELADGTTADTAVYDWSMRWFGRKRRVLVYDSGTASPAIGMGLLEGLRLTIDMNRGTVEISSELSHRTGRER